MRLEMPAAGLESYLLRTEDLKRVWDMLGDKWAMPFTFALARIFLGDIFVLKPLKWL